MPTVFTLIHLVRLELAGIHTQQAGIWVGLALTNAIQLLLLHLVLLRTRVVHVMNLEGPCTILAI